MPIFQCLSLFVFSRESHALDSTQRCRIVGEAGDRGNSNNGELLRCGRKRRREACMMTIFGTFCGMYGTWLSHYSNTKRHLFTFMSLCPDLIINTISQVRVSIFGTAWETVGEISRPKYFLLLSILFLFLLQMCLIRRAQSGDLDSGGWWVAS